MRINRNLLYIIISLMVTLAGCSDDPPEPTGRFSLTFTGGLSEQLEGEARFDLVPGSTIGRIIIYLEESETKVVRLTFFNPNPTQIFLEPGTYTVVTQAGQNVMEEVLVDYISNIGTISASTGEVQVGIVKNTQIKGNLVGVNFSTLNITCNGNFDAIPE